MANRAYLAVSDVRRIYPAFQNPTFSTKENWVLCSAGCVPLLWLALFEEIDLVTETFRSDQGPVVATAPLATRGQAVARLAQRRSLLNSLFEEEGGLDHHLGLFSSYLSSLRGAYVTMEVEEIACLHPDGEFDALLRNCLIGLSTGIPLVKDALVTLSTVIPDRRFITLEDARKGVYEQEDMWNYFRIMGEHYLREDVPWM